MRGARSLPRPLPGTIAVTATVRCNSFAWPLAMGRIAITFLVVFAILPRRKDDLGFRLGYLPHPFRRKEGKHIPYDPRELRSTRVGLCASALLSCFGRVYIDERHAFCARFQGIKSSAVSIHHSRT